MIIALGNNGDIQDLDNGNLVMVRDFNNKRLSLKKANVLLEIFESALADAPQTVTKTLIADNLVG